ncbi:hypothetical protein V6Z12_D07G077400 [Gossypium hirsutum]
MDMFGMFWAWVRVTPQKRANPKRRVRRRCMIWTGNDDLPFESKLERIIIHARRA